MIDVDLLRRHRFAFSLILISALALGLRFWGLASQPLTSDDVDVAVSASNFVTTGHLGPTMWNHPPLRSVLVFMSLALLGSSALALKLPSLILGALAVPLVGLVCRRLFSCHRTALVAAGLMAVDALHVDFSRQAVQEVYMATFALAGVWLVMAVRSRSEWWILPAAGLCFGLGLSSKWYVASTLLVTAIWAVASVMRHRDPGRSRWRFVALLLGGLALVPMTVYLLVYLPWFARGFPLWEWVELQRSMLLESVTHGGYIPYDLELETRAWMWFVKPLVGYADFAFEGGRPTVLVGLANPLVWLLVLPGLVHVAVVELRRSRASSLFLLAAFVLGYLPLVFTSRPIWVHTAFGILPFGVIAVARMMVHRLSTRWLMVWLTAVLVITVPLYLLAVGQGLELGFLQSVAESFRPLNER